MGGMRAIDEPDHYELLEVGRRASGMDIDRAWCDIIKSCYSTSCRSSLPGILNPWLFN